MVKNFYQPAPPIDWTESLDKVYKDEMAALDRHHAALRQNDQRRVEATITAGQVAQSISNLGTLAKFSKTVAQSVDAKKQEKFEVDYGKLEEIDRKIIKDTFKTEIDLTKDSDNVLDKLRKAGVSESALSLLEKNSAGNSLRLRRILGWENVKHSVIDLDNRIESGTEEGAALQNAYEGAYQNESVETFYRNDIYGKLNKLGFNDKYIATHFKDEIERIASTEGALASLDYKKVKFTEKIEEDIKSVQNIEYEGDAISSDSATETLRNIVKTHGKLKAAGFLHRLLKDGKINPSVIDAMQDGTITDFAAGDKGEFIFDQKTWDYIRSGATERRESIIAAKTAENESKATGLLSQLYQEDSPFKTQEQWNQAIQPLKGLVSQKTFTNLENQNLAAQGEVQTKRYLNEYSIDEANGTLDEKIEEIKTIPNNIAREYLLDKANKIKKWKEDPANKTAFDESNVKGEVYTARAGVAFDKTATVTTNEDNIIEQDLIAFRRQDLAKRILAQYGPDGTFTPNPNIATENAQALQLYKEANGWGVEGAGKFSLTGNPGEKKWGNYFNKGITPTYNHNAGLSENAAKNYNIKIKNNPDKKERHKKVNGIFSTDQLIGFLKTGTVSQDMLYIRSREGEPMSDLIEKGLNALANSKEHKDLVQQFNIKEFADSMPTPDRIILSKLLQSLESSTGNSQQLSQNLASIFKWYGPEALANSPNIAARIFDTIDKLPGNEKIEEQAATDQTNLETKRNLNARLTELDPSKFETILANPDEYPSSVVRDAQKNLDKLTKELDEIEEKLKQLNPT
jgi:hypothetical protein